MKYINTKTQAVIETACTISGGDWEKAETEQPKADADTAVKKNNRKKNGE